MAFSVQFDKYKYTGPKRGFGWDGSYAFNPEFYNTLLATRRWSDAYNYASQYEFDDPETQERYRSELKNLQARARILNTVYSKVEPGSDDDNAIAFRDNLFQQKGLNALTKSGNTYAQRFQQAKDALGSYSGNATNLGIKFANKKQTGIFGWDWIAKDNEGDINKFCELSGYTLDQLSNGLIDGVELVTTPDGHEIRFSKDNPEANKLLYGAYLVRKNTGSGAIIQGYDRGYNKLDAKGEISSNSTTNIAGQQLLYDMFDLFSEADARKDKLIADSKLGKVTTSTMLCGFVGEGIQAAYDSYIRGEIDHQTYNAIKSARQEQYDLQVRALGASKYQMYSNINNEEDTDETLREIQTTDRTKLMDEIGRAIKHKTITYQSAQSGGKLGTMITIDAPDEDDKHAKYKKRIQVFVPGLWTDRAQERINNNSTFKAAQEIGNMELYGYDYPLKNGSAIKVGSSIPDPNDPQAGLNRYFMYYDAVSGETYSIDREKAAKYIDQDMIMDDGLYNIRRAHLNKNGDIINQESISDEAKLLATAAVNNLYNDVAPLDPDSIFGTKVQTDSDGNIILDEHGNVVVQDENIQYQISEKIQAAYNIYDYILRNIIKREQQ